VLAGGLGFATAALVTPMATRRTALGRWIAACSALAAVAQAAVVAVLSLPVLLVAAYLVGVGVQSTKICVDAVLQRTSDDAYRGRVFSFYDVVYNAAFVASAAVAALTLPPDGYSRVALLASCLLYAAAAAGYVRVSRRGTSGSPVAA
jgi:MFS family permease